MAAAVVVLAVPPFWFAIAMTFTIQSYHIRSKKVQLFQHSVITAFQAFQRFSFSVVGSAVLCHRGIMETKRRHWQLIEAGEVIRTNPPQFGDKAFMTPWLVQATLPHSQPRNSPPEWFRKNGDFVLSIRPGYATDRKSGQRRCIGYPAGSVPRLLLFWMITEVKLGAGPKLMLGDNLSDFMRELGMNPRNGRGPRSDAKRLEREMMRLFAATITFEYSTIEVQRFRDMAVAPERELWWDVRDPDQSQLWRSWILLGSQFYAAINSNPFPVDLRVLRALKSSALALDLYAWATYKTFVVNRKGKPQAVPWRSLQQQVGTGYTRTRDFRDRASQVLREIGVVYHGLRFQCRSDALIIHPGETSIAS